MIRSLMTPGFLAAVAVACTVDNRVGTNDSPDASALVCRGAGPSPACPSTWELAQTQIDCIVGARYSILLGHSGAFLARYAEVGAQTSYCLYDPSTHALVGGLRWSTVADFCNETAQIIYYGVAEVGAEFVFDATLGEGPTCPGWGQCHAPVSASACPATWQQAQLDPICSLPPNIPVELGHAVGYLARSYSGGFSGGACYYDPVTFALVGAWNGSDVPSFCDETSFDIHFGDVNARLPFRPDLGVVPPCPDAGMGGAQ